MSAPQTEAIMHAMDMVALYSTRATNRPYRETSGIKLNNSPADCPHDCPECFLACAIIPARLDWWERELMRLGAAGSTGRAH